MNLNKTGKALMLECAYIAMQEELLHGDEQSIADAIHHYETITGSTPDYLYDHCLLKEDTHA